MRRTMQQVKCECNIAMLTSELFRKINAQIGKAISQTKLKPFIWWGGAGGVKVVETITCLGAIHK